MSIEFFFLLAPGKAGLKFFNDPLKLFFWIIYRRINDNRLVLQPGADRLSAIFTADNAGFHGLLQEEYFLDADAGKVDSDSRYQNSGNFGDDHGTIMAHHPMDRLGKVQSEPDQKETN